MVNEQEYKMMIIIIIRTLSRKRFWLNISSSDHEKTKSFILAFTLASLAECSRDFSDIERKKEPGRAGISKGRAEIKFENGLKNLNRQMFSDKIFDEDEAVTSVQMIKKR